MSVCDVIHPPTYWSKIYLTTKRMPLTSIDIQSIFFVHPLSFFNSALCHFIPSIRLIITCLRRVLLPEDLHSSSRLTHLLSAFIRTSLCHINCFVFISPKEEYGIPIYFWLLDLGLCISSIPLPVVSKNQFLLPIFCLFSPPLKASLPNYPLQCLYYCLVKYLV
jgi:hypothetical protein